MADVSLTPNLACMWHDHGIDYAKALIMLQVFSMGLSIVTLFPYSPSIVTVAVSLAISEIFSVKEW